jgi:hypothetical protein
LPLSIDFVIDTDFTLSFVAIAMPAASSDALLILKPLDSLSRDFACADPETPSHLCVFKDDTFVLTLKAMVNLLLVFIGHHALFFGDLKGTAFYTSFLFSPLLKVLSAGTIKT